MAVGMSAASIKLFRSKGGGYGNQMTESEIIPLWCCHFREGYQDDTSKGGVELTPLFGQWTIRPRPWGTMSPP